MGTLKVGQAEEKLISEVEAFKAKYVDRLKYMEDGLELAQKQIPDNAKGESKDIAEKIGKARGFINRLRRIIESMSFSKEHSEEKFCISWNEIYVAGEQYYQFSYGQTTWRKEPVTETQFVYALTSWEKEVEKSIILFKQIGGYMYNLFCTEMESHIHRIVDEYVNPKKT